ncbi:HNH endonuclease [Promicromonospora sp. MS192]|uniref:HNH endonuclease n=1 Tax=Promicromonospora sp. MS192 TaxID=3412684 RepID=UPI003C304A7D
MTDARRGRSWPTRWSNGPPDRSTRLRCRSRSTSSSRTRRCWAAGTSPLSSWTGRVPGTASSRPPSPATSWPARWLADLLRIRDQGACRTPWCDAPIRHLDHVRAAARGGGTELANGQGLCAACNQAKEAPGWSSTAGTDPETGRHVVITTTPTGHRYRSVAPRPPRPADLAPPPPRPADRTAPRRSGPRTAIPQPGPPTRPDHDTSENTAGISGLSRPSSTATAGTRSHRARARSAGSR